MNLGSNGGAANGTHPRAIGFRFVRSAAQDQTTDAELLLGVQSRDEDALATLYDRYSGLLYTLALRICGQRGQAEEVLQDVFSAAWRAAGQWNPDRGSVQAWLVTMTRNKAIDALRASARSSPLPLTIDMESHDAGPDELAVQHVISHEVRNALSQLPHRYREVLEAVYFAGMSQREIALKFGLPHGTVKSRIRLAIERLARALKARGIDR